MRLPVGLPGDLEERGPQDKAGEEHQDQAERDDAGQRPELGGGCGLHRSGDYPAEEPGGSEGKPAKEQEVPDAAEYTPAVVEDGGERGEDVEGGEQQPCHADHVGERLLDRGGQQVRPGERDKEHADDDAGRDRAGKPLGHVAEESR